MRTKNLIIMGKITITTALLIVIFVWTLFIILIMPMIMIMIYHSTKGRISNFRLSLAMIPVGIVAILIVRMWKPALIEARGHD